MTSRGSRARPREQWLFRFGADEEEPWLLCSKAGSRYRLHFPGLADFYLDENGREITIAPKPGLPFDTLQHLLLDQVLPLTLSLRDRHTLHATAVLTPFGACAFTGPSGSGKSTLAASFHVAGYPVISDDCLVLDLAGRDVRTVPGYAGVRLWDDSFAHLFGKTARGRRVAHYSTKHRVPITPSAAEWPDEPVRLVRIYCLAGWERDHRTAPDVQPRLAPLSGQEGLMRLITSAFQLNVTDRHALASQFEFFGQVITRVPLRALHLPKRFAALPAVRDAVLADLPHP
jgi:hypothetical protein